jgi:predicted nucleic acid-binding protein
LIPNAVLDTSAAVNLVLNNRHAADLAAKLDETAFVMTPDLFCSEVASALWKYVRAGSLALETAIARFEECIGLISSFVPGRELAHEALAAAARHQCSVYDMMYGVLARRSAALVITMDRSFARRLGEMEIDSYCPLLEPGQ